MKIELRQDNRDLLIYRDGLFLTKIYWEDVGWGGMSAVEALLLILIPDITWIEEAIDED